MPDVKHADVESIMALIVAARAKFRFASKPPEYVVSADADLANAEQICLIVLRKGNEER